MIDIDRKHLFHLLLIGLFVVLGIPLLVLQVSGFTGLQFVEVSNLVSAVGSILLSAILAYLYLQMWSTQEERTTIHENQEAILDRQADIQEKQHDILQTEKQALIDITNQDFQGDDCTLSISNHGGGAIVELHLVTQIGTESQRTSSPNKSTQLTMGGSNSGGKIVGPKETNIIMKCCPQFEFQIQSETKSGPFSTITTLLSREDIKRITVEITLVARDEFGHPIEERLVEKEVEIHQSMELAEINSWKNN